MRNKIINHSTVAVMLIGVCVTLGCAAARGINVSFLLEFFRLEFLKCYFIGLIIVYVSFLAVNKALNKKESLLVIIKAAAAIIVTYAVFRNFLYGFIIAALFLPFFFDELFLGMERMNEEDFKREAETVFAHLLPRTIGEKVVFVNDGKFKSVRKAYEDIAELSCVYTGKSMEDINFYVDHFILKVKDCSVKRFSHIYFSDGELQIVDTELIPQELMQNSSRYLFRNREKLGLKKEDFVGVLG